MQVRGNGKISEIVTNRAPFSTDSLAVVGTTGSTTW